MQLHATRCRHTRLHLFLSYQVDHVRISSKKMRPSNTAPYGQRRDCNELGRGEIHPALFLLLAIFFVVFVAAVVVIAVLSCLSSSIFDTRASKHGNTVQTGYIIPLLLRCYDRLKLYETLSMKVF